MFNFVRILYLPELRHDGKNDFEESSQRLKKI